VVVVFVFEIGVGRASTHFPSPHGDTHMRIVRGAADTRAVSSMSSESATHRFRRRHDVLWYCYAAARSSTAARSHTRELVQGRVPLGAPHAKAQYHYARCTNACYCSICVRTLAHSPPAGGSESTRIAVPRTAAHSRHRYASGPESWECVQKVL
jgi:hypothetical protein